MRQKKTLRYQSTAMDRPDQPQHPRVRSILFVTYHFPPEIGGVNTRIYNYVRELRRRNVGVAVLVLVNRGTRVKRYTLDGADVIVSPGQVPFLIRNALYLSWIALTKSVDVIHIFTGASTTVGFSALLLGRAIRVPSFISYFGTELYEDGGPMQRLLQPFALRFSNSISVNSPQTRNLIPPAFHGKTRILLGGAQIRPSTSMKSNETNPSILFVGRLVERKGGDDLIRAFGTLKEEVANCRLTFVGDGNDRTRLQTMANDLNLSADVEFRGALIGSELDKAYEESSVVVLPSKHVENDSQIEGLGLTLIEGAMHGKPLIGTNHGGIPSVIKDGVNGFLVPEGNPQMLARALFKILSNHDLARRLGTNALAMAQDEFTWEAATDRLLDSYNELPKA